MLFVLALVLAIPTYGLSVGAYLAYLVFGIGRRHVLIRRALIRLADEPPTMMGTCFREISYVHGLKFAQASGSEHVTLGSMVRFNIEIEGRLLDVTVNKEPAGNGAIFTARDAR